MRPAHVKPELRALLPHPRILVKATNLRIYITGISDLAFSGQTEERAAMLFRCVALLLFLALVIEGIKETPSSE